MYHSLTTIYLLGKLLFYVQIYLEKEHKISVFNLKKNYNFSENFSYCRIFRISFRYFIKTKTTSIIGIGIKLKMNLFLNSMFKHWLLNSHLVYIKVDLKKNPIHQGFSEPGANHIGLSSFPNSQHLLS